MKCKDLVVFLNELKLSSMHFYVGEMSKQCTCMYMYLTFIPGIWGWDEAAAILS